MNTKKKSAPVITARTDRRVTFAERLRDLRKTRGWTMAFVAEKAALSEGYMSLLESGVRVPSFATQQTLAKIFGMKIGRLMEGVE